MRHGAALRFLGSGSILLLLLLAFAPPASADIIIQGSPEFMAKVEACLEKIQMTGGSAAETLSKLLGAKNNHVIKESKKNNSNTAENGNGERKPDGTPGSGAGSTTTWDPGHTANYTDDVARDPCASLFHELVHAGQSEMGTQDSTPGHNGIPKDEIEACTEENKYRKANGLPQRKKYGGKDLPPSAISLVAEKEVYHEME